ncbi:unnamed protein product [Amoebophrya sp. A25]|nr:unnamed protein product [Amoebophrya sp. A25]|eukprot:GSA25T00024315001.1
MFICSDSSDEDDLGAQNFALKFGDEAKCDLFLQIFNSLRQTRSLPPGWVLPDSSGAGPASAPTAAPAESGAASTAGAEKTKDSGAKSPAALSPKKVPTSVGAAPAGGLFGSVASAAEETKPVTGLFGTTTATSGSLFGGGSTSGGGGLFGGSAPSSSASGGLFGGSSQSSPPAACGLFGGSTQTTTSSGGGLFGGGATSPMKAKVASTAPGAAPATSSSGGASAAPALGSNSVFTSTAERDAFIKKAELTAKAERTKEFELVKEDEVWDPNWGADSKVRLQVKNTKSQPDDELEIYRHRAKLFRFRDNEWKDRGIGDAQLLQKVVDTEDGTKESQVRFILRQEKTGKVQANFALPDASANYCVLAANSGNDKTWCFTAYDCSEEEPAATMLSLKFRDKDVAEKFKDAWDNAKSNLVGAISAADVKKFEIALAEAQSRDGNAPKPAPSRDVPETKKPEENNTSAKASSPPAAPSSSGGLFGGGFGALGGATTTTSIFDKAGGSSTTPGTGLFGATSSTTGGLFGAATASSTAAAPTGGGSLFGGGSSASGNLFGASNKGAPSNPFAPSSPSGGGARQDQSGKTQEELDLEEIQKEVWEGNYDVKVHLQAKDKVETGLEHEETVYVGRTKILRLRDGQMKQRGLGETRLLRDKNTGRIRLILRQDKVGKVRINFALTGASGLCTLSRTPTPDFKDFESNVWYLTVFDCSEDDDEGRTERIAIKHKTEELSEKFAEIFKQAVIESDGTTSGSFSGHKLPVLTEDNSSMAPGSKSAETQDQGAAIGPPPGAATKDLAGIYLDVSGNQVGCIDTDRMLTYEGTPYPLVEIVPEMRFEIHDQDVGAVWAFDAQIEAGTLTWDHGEFWIKDFSLPAPAGKSKLGSQAKEFNIFTPPLPAASSGFAPSAGANAIPVGGASQKTSSFGASTTTISAAPAPAPFQLKKPADPDKWTCPVCNCKWPQDKMQCGACDAYKPGVDEEKIKREKEEQKKATMAKLLGGSSGGGDAPPATSTAAATFSFGASASNGTSQPISFGAPAPAPAASSSSVFSFGATPSPAAATASSSPKKIGSAAVTVAPSSATAAVDSKEMKALERQVKDAVAAQDAFKRSIHAELDDLRKEVLELASAAPASSGSVLASSSSESAIREATRKIEALSTKLAKSEEGNKKQFAYIQERIEELATKQETAVVDVDAKLAAMEQEIGNQVNEKILSLRTKIGADLNAVRSSQARPSTMMNSGLDTDRVYALVNEQNESVLQETGRQVQEVRDFAATQMSETEKRFEKMVSDMRDALKHEMEGKFDKIRTQNAYNPASSSFSSRLSNLRAQRGNMSVGTPETVTVFGNSARRDPPRSGVFTPTQLTPNRDQTK